MRTAGSKRSGEGKPRSGWADDRLVIGLFLSFRLFAILMLQYGGIFGGSSDFDYYLELGRQADHGALPYLTYWSEYPPLFPWLAVGVYRLAEVIARAPPTASFYEPLLRLALLPFELGNLLLVRSIARALHSEVAASRRTWLYTGLFAPLFVWLGWFEPLPVFLTLLSLKLLLDRRAGWAGLVCGLGIATKILPGLVGLTAVRQAVARGCPRAALVDLGRFAARAIGAGGVVAFPFALLNREVFLVSARSWLGRPPWESVWAVLGGYSSFGFVPSLVARAGWPTYVPSLGSAGVTAALPSVALLLVLGVVVWLPWQTDQPSGLVAVTGSLLAATFLVSAGFSPQFVDWVLPFVVILLPEERAFAYATALTGVVLLGERYLYFWLFPPSRDLLAGLVALRCGLFVLLLGEFWTTASLARRALSPWLRRLAAGGIAGGAVILGALALRVYASGGWGTAVLEDPARRSANLIRQRTDGFDALLTFDRGRYETLGPWLSDRAFYYLAPASVSAPADRERVLRTVVASHANVVVVDEPPGGEAASAEAWLTRYGKASADRIVETGASLRRFAFAPGLTWPAQAPEVDQRARFRPGLDLLGYTASRVGGGQGSTRRLRLTLVWRASTAVAAPLDLTFQLRDPVGRVVAQQDGRIGRRFPPTDWPVGQVVLDDEEITLHRWLADGPLSVAVGWHDRRDLAGLPTSGVGVTDGTMVTLVGLVATGD